MDIALAPALPPASMHLKRSQTWNPEPPSSKLSNGCRYDVAATNHLSELLDDERNEEMMAIMGGHVSSSSTPDETLSKILSLRSELSTASSFALFHQNMRQEPGKYRPIGFGRCGLVFERPGRPYAVKVAKQCYKDSLWTDFVCHFKVHQAFETHQPECAVPRLLSYVTEENESWWSAHKQVFPAVNGCAEFPLPSMAIISERILPLPKISRRALIEKFCPEEFKQSAKTNPANRDCLARVYLGRRHSSNKNKNRFSLRNFNLCLDQMLEIGLPVETYARVMAEALAVIHWEANIDGFDVEFVLGGESDTTYPESVARSAGLNRDKLAIMEPHTDIDSIIQTKHRMRTSRLWILDFNLCHSWNETLAREAPEVLIEQLVVAFFDNEPYYPLPLGESEAEQRLWASFRDEYLRKSDEILQAKDSTLTRFPMEFIETCVAREHCNLRKGLGHGRRESDS